MEPTGIKNLDSVLGGGLPLPAALALTGPLGTGKTVLGRQLVANFLARDFAVMYYCIDEAREDCISALKGYGVDVDKHVESGQLYFLDLFSKGVESLGDRLATEQTKSVLGTGFSFSDLVEMGRGFTLKNLTKKQFGFMDSITPLFLTANQAEVYQYCQTLKYATRFANAIGIGVLHEDVVGKSVENAFLGFADGIISMSKRNQATGKEVEGGGFLKVVRMKDQQYKTDPTYYMLQEGRLVFSDLRVII